MIVLYILLAVVILLFMVLIHEFGHYVAGKILKFKITEFSVGFGFPIFSKTNKKTGEKFSLRIFPLGGYCAFEGEDDDKESASPTAFNNQKPWKRIIVFLAGVTANFLTAIIFSWVLLSTIGYDVPQVARDVTYNENVFMEGDVITHIDGQKIDFAFGENYVTLMQRERAKAKNFYESESYDGGNYSFEMTISRNGEIQNASIIVYQVASTEGETTTY
ncbi:MAG: site-2 protease family protein, partial [Candidatus Caccovivens sp.]